MKVYHSKYHFYNVLKAHVVQQQSSQQTDHPQNSLQKSSDKRPQQLSWEEDSGRYRIANDVGSKIFVSPANLLKGDAQSGSKFTWSARGRSGRDPQKGQ